MNVNIKKIKIVPIFFQCHLGLLLALVINKLGKTNPTKVEHNPPNNFIYPLILT